MAREVVKLHIANFERGDRCGAIYIRIEDVKYVLVGSMGETTIRTPYEAISVRESADEIGKLMGYQDPIDVTPKATAYLEGE